MLNKKYWLFITISLLFSSGIIIIHQLTTTHNNQTQQTSWSTYGTVTYHNPTLDDTHTIKHQIHHWQVSDTISYTIAFLLIIIVILIIRKLNQISEINEQKELEQLETNPI